MLSLPIYAYSDPQVSISSMMSPHELLLHNYRILWLAGLNAQRPVGLLKVDGRADWRHAIDGCVQCAMTRAIFSCGRHVTNNGLIYLATTALLLEHY